ncbi:MAG: SagB/ThcOx family dehydrogenase [Terracidiphilus sp.]|jgi:nitroreductase
MRIVEFFVRRRAAALLALLALAWGAQLVAWPHQGATAVQAAELQPIQLPKPEITAGMPLMRALAQRRTTRAFQDKPLPMQTLSNLLWAAFGVNRPRNAKPGLGRTAPSAMNKQEVEIDVVLAQGAYVYDAEANRLRPLVGGDLRAKMGAPPAGLAAVTLVYVADAKLDYAQVDTGFIGQNVYLFAASEGLNAWFYALHGQQDATEIAAALKLPAEKRPLFAQSVGYPPQ